MRIGIMLRHFQQHEGGVKVYTQNLLRVLLPMDQRNHYVLMYKNRDLLGTYASYPNVTEVALEIPGSVTWDQVAVPILTRRERVDVLFNPKFTVPFLANTKCVFVVHGSEWFVIPKAFTWYDRVYFRRFVPLYMRRACKFITVSQAVKRDVIKFCGVDPNKIEAIHNGYDDSLFRPVESRERLNEIRRKYGLPERFLLWVGQIYPPKNVGRLLEAFARLKDDFPHHLVLVGERRWGGKRELEMIERLGIKDRVLLIGWVSHDELPIFYNLAELFVFPSLYEGFGIPLLEAMACGCPVVTSNTCSPPEVVDGAGCLVDPLDVQDIADKIRGVLGDARVRAEMSERGLAQVAAFSWKQTAAQVLDVLESLAD